MIDPWCHGSALARDPVSGRWIYGHMGHGQSGTDPKCSVCTTGVTPKDAPTAPCPRESNVTVSVVGALVADSPLGPWMPAQNIINGANCVSFFTRNGTLFQVSTSSPGRAKHTTSLVICHHDALHAFSPL